MDGNDIKVRLNVNELAQVLKDAHAAAVAQKPADDDFDGGSANLDTPAFRIDRARESKIMEAATIAGVNVTPFECFEWMGGRKWYWLNVPTYGQAFFRERAMQAAQDILNAAARSGKIPGLRACGYQQAD